MPIQAREPTPYADCFDTAGQHYGLAPELLEAIAHAESRSEPTALNTSNRDGSWDIGLMQINSRWMPVLERAGLTAQQLYDPCTSIWVGAWVLAGNVARYGYNWNAVGAYNAGTAATAAAQRRRERYADRIRRLLCRADGLCADDAAP
ncbi:MAG: lytic transglycosylase domain-containing protein [Panacagrimonas sp.]